jgi:very-short-patch-repair endonuclease
MERKSKQYSIDFAIPNLKIGLEADGEAFHGSAKQITHDAERDQCLNQMGWTIMRFTDEEIENKLPEVMRTIVKNIMDKELSLKQQLSAPPQG